MIEPALSTFEQLPCEGCGHRGSACTCKPKPATPPAVPLGQQSIPSRQKVLDDMRALRSQISIEAEAVTNRIAADHNYLQWLNDYGSALDSAIYGLTPREG
jgi:hypothetical protein